MDSNWKFTVDNDYVSGYQSKKAIIEDGGVVWQVWNDYNIHTHIIERQIFLDISMMLDDSQSRPA